MQRKQKEEGRRGARHHLAGAIYVTEYIPERREIDDACEIDLEMLCRYVVLVAIPIFFLLSLFLLSRRLRPLRGSNDTTNASSAALIRRSKNRDCYL